MIYHSIHGLSNKIIAGRFMYTNFPAIIILLISEPLLSLFAYGFEACVIHVPSYLIRLLDVDTQRK